MDWTDLFLGILLVVISLLHYGIYHLIYLFNCGLFVILSVFSWM